MNGNDNDYGQSNKFWAIDDQWIATNSNDGNTGTIEMIDRIQQNGWIIISRTGCYSLHYI